MRYSYDRLQGATKYLQSQLAKQNYIAGQVKLISAEYDAKTNRADITFEVTTGPVVKVAHHRRAPRRPHASQSGPDLPGERGQR